MHLPTHTGELPTDTNGMTDLLNELSYTLNAVTLALRGKVDDKTIDLIHSGWAGLYDARKQLRAEYNRAV